MGPRWVWTLGALAVAGVGIAGYAFSNRPQEASVQAVTTLAVDAAPGLRLPDLTGKIHTLADWRGKVVLVNFWASWCSPCMYEIDDLIRYQARYADRGLRILGVGVDEPRKLANVRRSLKITYPVLVADPNSGVLEDWGDRQRMIPYSVLVDRRGRVVWRYQGMLSETLFNERVLPHLAPATAFAAD